jgi:hypothetical protein
VPSELIIGGALANCGRDAPTDEFLELLVRETPELAIYRFQPRPRLGIDAKAALDWQGILGTAADLLAFATVLWATYERYVKPRLERKALGPDPFLLITLRKRDGSFVQFSIGSEHRDKDIFIEQFTREVQKLREGEDNSDTSATTQFSRSEDWVRVSVRDREDS